MKYEITLSVSELKRAIAGLNKVSRSSPLPALRCALLARPESGPITLTVTVLESVATYRLAERSPGPAVEMLVPWEALTKATKITKDRVVFVKEGDTSMAVRSFIGSMSFEEPVPTEPLKEWPDLPKLEGPDLVVTPDLKKALGEALSCCSGDSSRHVLQGACLDVRNEGGHYVVGTDGRQLYAANTFTFNLPGAIIVPNRKFLTWSGFTEDSDWKMRVQLEGKPEPSGWVEFTSDRWTFTTRLIVGEYPNWKQIFPGETNPPISTAHRRPSAGSAGRRAEDP